MGTGLMLALICLLALVVAAPPAQAKPIRHDVELILDSSASMWGRIDGQPKKLIARRALVELAEKLKNRSDLFLALRVYGHQHHYSRENCLDTKLEIPFSRPDPVRVGRLVEAIKSQGQTPLGLSLQKARDDFDLEADHRRSIILITDGRESCESDPCRVARLIAKSGAKITIHVIGFGLKKKDVANLACIARPSGGRVIAAANAAQLSAALGQLLAEPVSVAAKSTAPKAVAAKPVAAVTTTQPPAAPRPTTTLAAPPTTAKPVLKSVRQPAYRITGTIDRPPPLPPAKPKPEPEVVSSTTTPPAPVKTAETEPAAAPKAKPASVSTTAPAKVARPAAKTAPESKKSAVKPKATASAKPAPTEAKSDKAKPTEAESDRTSSAPAQKAEPAGPPTLVVKAIDSVGRPVWVTVRVYALSGGPPLAQKAGHTIEFSLAPGAYRLTATEAQSGQKVDLSGVMVRGEGAVAVEQIIF